MSERPRSVEITREAISGWPVLIALVLFEAVLIGGLIHRGREDAVLGLGLALAALVFFLTLAGFFINGPNMSRPLVLFGRYQGTVRKQGLFWTNPFMVKHRVSLRAHNVASEKIKVNDLVGNPIEIGAVVVWQVADTAQALFDVEDYMEFVDIQIEAAVRQVASSHPYDEGQDAPSSVVSLRGDSEEVAVELQRTLSERLQRAGIEVLEARLSHLAYAPEIASAMLQRQQAQAIIAARRKIVEGAVGMVEQALADLGDRGVIELDDERRATLVGNLLVVLCGQAHPQPVLNTGGLYN
ncbi:MAG: SPFH domain-containing protein [Planctomycetota bacterium]|nr:MAG: SPFH domain-containing protein [Planctomycetota bacterium]